MLRLFSLRSNLALCLVLRILFPILLNHVLFISLHVRADELMILVKPIGISTHVLMSISFGTKIPTFLNILVLLKVVGISVISLVLRFSIMPALTLSSKYQHLISMIRRNFWQSLKKFCRWRSEPP